MSLVPIHQGSAVSSHLPLSLDVALAVIAVGGLVLIVLAYDAYRTYEWRPETGANR